ncbi:hypothetical protein PMIN01_02895 [Paraphaeosphaeria minitans]|uniref:EthD domain-containing protein n=1 Tax=Paraphaeosphaeria minitans TaxID=565426 RepID=A0A9P6KVD9_9PLEO|nr:hypothetical protein PMIN01_02895 [Paraphaeosphaeria minitans]
MTCITLPFLTRKPILTLEQFEDCYENTHLPYIKSVFGQLAALKHRRWYLARADSKDSGYPPGIIEDEEALHELNKVYTQSEAIAKLAEDEERFVIKLKMKADTIGEIKESSP